MPRSMPKVVGMMDLDESDVTADGAERGQAPVIAAPPTGNTTRLADPALGYVGVDDLMRAEIGRVFGPEVLVDSRKVEAIGRSVWECERHTTQILSSVVCLGRSLLKLRELLGVRAMSRGFRNGQGLFRGWSPGNLVKIMAVAEFVDRFEFDLDALPKGWSVVYELSTIPAPVIARAREGKLISPDVTRAQVVAFKKRIFDISSETGEVASARETAVARLAEMRATLKKLDTQRRDLAQQIKDAEADPALSEHGKTSSNKHAA